MYFLPLQKYEAYEFINSREIPKNSQIMLKTWKSETSERILEAKTDECQTYPRIEKLMMKFFV